MSLSSDSENTCSLLLSQSITSPGGISYKPTTKEPIALKKCKLNERTRNKKSCINSKTETKNNKYRATVCNNIKKIENRINLSGARMLNGKPQFIQFASREFAQARKETNRQEAESVESVFTLRQNQIVFDGGCWRRTDIPVTLLIPNSQTFLKHFQIRQIPETPYGIMYRIPRSLGKKCLVKAENGAYYEKTIYFLPKTSGVLKAKYQGFNRDFCQQEDHPILDTSFQEIPSTNLAIYNRFHNLHDKKYITAKGRSDEKQIDPSIAICNSESHFSQTKNSSRINRSKFSHFRKPLKEKKQNRKRSQSRPPQQSLVRRFLSIFKRAPKIANRRSGSSFPSCFVGSSSNSNQIYNNLFCWTCFEMTEDDDSHSSVDSESGSDDNEDPNEGDGDDQTDIDDFNNQEDIEAIEYSSGGGDGSDNSSQDGNDSWWQDDLINQETTNCQNVYDMDDCEDDEIEIARKATFAYQEEHYTDLDVLSYDDRQDWLGDSLDFGRYEYDVEATINESRYNDSNLDF